MRSELTSAASLRKEAAAQLAAVDAKMQALPAEIEALKRRGAEEIAAEEARISGLAEAERQRLLEQATREIETQLRVAERDLKQRAGELAVEVATARVKRTITSGRPRAAGGPVRGAGEALMLARLRAAVSGAGSRVSRCRPRAVSR